MSCLWPPVRAKSQGVSQAVHKDMDLDGKASFASDKAYDRQELIDQIVAQGCVAVIPPRKNRKTPREYDKHIYKERHLIETLFGKRKHLRCVFARFDKTKDAYAAFIAIPSALCTIDLKHPIERVHIFLKDFSGEPKIQGIGQ